MFHLPGKRVGTQLPKSAQKKKKVGHPVGHSNFSEKFLPGSIKNKKKTSLKKKSWKSRPKKNWADFGGCVQGGIMVFSRGPQYCLLDLITWSSKTKSKNKLLHISQALNIFETWVCSRDNFNVVLFCSLTAKTTNLIFFIFVLFRELLSEDASLTFVAKQSTSKHFGWQSAWLHSIRFNMSKDDKLLYICSTSKLIFCQISWKK